MERTRYVSKTAFLFLVSITLRSRNVDCRDRIDFRFAAHDIDTNEVHCAKMHTAATGIASPVQIVARSAGRAVIERADLIERQAGKISLGQCWIYWRVEI